MTFNDLVAIISSFGVLEWLLVGLSGLAFGLVGWVFVLIIQDLLHEPISEGTIIEKRYETARLWIQNVPITVGNIILMAPIFHFDDEDWILVIEGSNDEGEIQQDNVYV